MSNRRAIVFAVVVVIAIGAIVVLTLRAFAPPLGDTNTAPPTAVASPAPVGHPVDTDTDDPSASKPESSPPWLQAQLPAVGPAETGAATTDNPRQAQRAQQVAELHASMRGVIAAATARSAETNQHLRDALDTLETMNDPTVTSQIDLAAVRHNLEISIRMQTIAQQLQQTGAQPAGPERQQKIDASMAELRRLQSQLRTDVRAPGSTLPAPPALLEVP